MDNYADFYCKECKYYTVLNDTKRGTDRTRCDMHEKYVEPEDAGCENFELEEEERL